MTDPNPQQSFDQQQNPQDQQGTNQQGQQTPYGQQPAATTPEQQPAYGAYAAQYQQAQYGQAQAPQAQQPPQYGQPAQPQQPEYGAYAAQYQQPQYQTPQAQTPQYGQPSAPQTPQTTQPEYGQYAAQPQPQYAPQGQYAQQPQYGQYAQPAADPAQQPQQTPQAQQYQQYQQQYQQPTNPYAPANPYAQANPYANPAAQGMPGAPLPQGAPTAAYATEPPLNLPWYGIGFGEAIGRLFKKLTVVQGRASRGEFWWAFLFLWLVGFGIGFLFAAVKGPTAVINTIWTIVWALLLIAVTIRRLHDTNRSGWFLLIYVVPQVVGFVLSFTAQPLIAQLENALPSLSSMQTPEEIQAWSMNLLAQYGSTLTLFALYALANFVCMIVMVVLLAGRSKPEGARFDA